MKKSSKNLIYISQGNIPSKWAHTFQTMKQAEAMAGLVQNLTLLTARALLPSPIDTVDLWRWYGVHEPFRILRLPVFLRTSDSYFSEHRLPRFDLAAGLIARLLNPDVIYTRSAGAAKYCVRIGLPTILETHAPGEYDVGNIAPLVRETCFLGLVTVAEELRRQYVTLGIPDAKILVSHDAIDSHRFDRPINKHESRRELELDVDSRIVLYCGHFYPEKGVETIVRTAPLKPDTQFYFVGGWTEDIKRLKTLSDGMKNVHFAGFVANNVLPKWLASADILVLPNSGKFKHARVTSPLKLYEYMAAGRPIVASDIPALSGILVDHRNSLLVKPDSPEALATAIGKLEADPQLGERLSREAQIYITDCTWKNRAISIFDSYNLW